MIGGRTRAAGTTSLSAHPRQRREALDRALQAWGRDARRHLRRYVLRATFSVDFRRVGRHLRAEDPCPYLGKCNVTGGRAIIREWQPQSSVVPSCSTGMYLAACNTRSRTSSGDSTAGSKTSITPINTLWPGRKTSLIVCSTRTGCLSLASRT